MPKAQNVTSTGKPSRSNTDAVVSANLEDLLEEFRAHMHLMEEQAKARKRLAQAGKDVDASWARLVNRYAVLDALVTDPG